MSESKGISVWREARPHLGPRAARSLRIGEWISGWQGCSRGHGGADDLRLRARLGRRQDLSGQPVQLKAEAE